MAYFGLIRATHLAVVAALAGCVPSSPEGNLSDDSIQFTRLNGPMSEEDVRSLKAIGISLNDGIEDVRSVAERHGYYIHEKRSDNEQLIVSIRGIAATSDFCADQGARFSMRAILSHGKEIDEISCSSERATPPSDVASYEIIDRDARNGNGLKLYVLASNDARRSVLEITCGTVVTGSFSGGDPCIRINQGSDSYAYVERHIKESKVTRKFNNTIRIKK